MAALALFIPWLGHLFYPWGFILQILALVHLVRRRGEYYWFFIILAGGMIGALAYMVMEVLPDARLLGQAYARHGRKARIRAVETAILDNPSPANYEELGELWLDQQEYARAREAFNRSIAARGDSVYAYYRRALSALALEDYAGAAPDLEHVIRSDPRFDSHRAAALLAHAYAKTGNGEGAEAWFAEVTQHSTALETLYNYACFLKSQNRREEACAWAQRMLEKKRTLPRYMQRIERPWFRKAQALLKELAPP